MRSKKKRSLLIIGLILLLLIAAGIKAIWCFAPTHLDVPDGILVQYENMATSFAVLSMHLQAQMKEKK